MIEFGEAAVSSFDEVDMPETLYKYRDWNDKNHRRMISHQEVFFASPSSFEDILDCKNPTRYDLLTDEEILNKYFQDSWKVQPNFTIEDRMLFAIDWANHTMVNKKEYLEMQQKKTFAEFDDFAGVLSLTAHPKEIRMWEKYAINHTGFCVGFDPKIMLRKLGTGGGIVNYERELPIIYPTPKHNYMQQTALQIFFKLDIWGFEKEYRTYRFRNYPLSLKDRAVVVPAEAFKELIIGNKMSAQDEGALLNSIPHKLSHVKIQRGLIENDTIVLKDL